MDAATIRRNLAAAGIQLEPASGGIRATPKEKLTPEIRALILTHKPELLRLMSARSTPLATPDQQREICAYLDRILGGHPDKPEALAIALRMPEAALEGFRADEAEGRL